MNINSRWSNYPYIEKIAGDGSSGEGTIIDKVNVEITGTTGEASGSGSISGSTLNIILNNIKGETGIAGAQGKKGDKGDPGIAGKITNVQATIDDNVGVPSVEVQLGGTETERTITLNFKNLKGATGAQGVSGEKGETGQKGEKGDPGEVTAESMLTLFKANGYLENDAAVLISKLVQLVQAQ